MRGLAIAGLGVMVLAPDPAVSEPYVSAQLGYASTEWSRGSPLNGVIDDRGLAYGVDLGFPFGERWGVELGTYGYEGFDGRGTPCAPGAVCTAVVTEISGSEVNIVKVGLARDFVIGETRLFATAGYYRARIDANLALPEAKSRDRGFVFGVGARWYFSDPWSVSVQATRFDDNLKQIMFGVGWGLRREREETIED
jgi:hypothetical protein